MENKDVQNLLEDLISEFEEMDIDDNLNESQIVRIDNASRRQAMLNRAILAVAKENQDPLYFKYMKAKKRAMYLRELLRQRYYSKGKAKISTYRF